MTDGRRLTLAPYHRYALVYLVYFAASNVFTAYRNDFFDTVVGLSGTQMGVIGALFVGSGLFAQPIWGAIADRTGRSKSVLIVGAVVSGIAALAYPVAPTTAAPFAVLAAATIVLSVFRSPIVPIANAMVLTRGLPFGSVRAVGSLAWGLGALASGVVVTGAVLGPLSVGDSTVGPIAVPGIGLQSVFLVYVVGMTLTVLVVRGVPAPAAEFGIDLRRDALGLLSDHRYLVLLATGVLFGGVTIAGDAYLSVYMGELAESDALTGVAWLTKTVAEASVLVAMARHGADDRWAAVFGAIALIVGFGTLGLTRVVPIALGGELLVGCGWGGLIYATVQLAHRVGPEGLEATAQTVLALALGVGRVTGELIAGPVYQFSSIHTLFVVLSVGATTIVVAGLALVVVVEPADYAGSRQSATTGT